MNHLPILLTALLVGCSSSGGSPGSDRGDGGASAAEDAGSDAGDGARSLAPCPETGPGFDHGDGRFSASEPLLIELGIHLRESFWSPGVCAAEVTHAVTGSMETRTEWTSDARGRVVEVRQTFHEQAGIPDERSEVEYDGRGRPSVRRSYSGGRDDPHTVTEWRYDHCGRLAELVHEPLRATDGDLHPSVRRYGYSEADGGHQAVERYEVDGRLDLTTTRSWDADGRLLEERREQGDGELQRVATYVWDGDLLTGIDWTTHQAWRFRYESRLIVGEDHLRNDEVEQRTTHGWDAEGLRTESVTVRGEDGDEQRRYAFGYDAEGRLVGVEASFDGRLTWLHVLEYDCAAQG